MPLSDFFNDDEFGNIDSWADDDFDISLVTIEDDTKVLLPIVRDPPYMVKISNLNPEFQETHLKTLFQYYLDIFTQLPAFFENHKRQFQNELRYVPGKGIRIKKFKIFNEISHNDNNNNQKVAFVEFFNLVDLNIVILWNDLNLLNKELFNFCLILKLNDNSSNFFQKNYQFEALLFKKKNSEDKINFKLADFFDFKKYISNDSMSSSTRIRRPSFSQNIYHPGHSSGESNFLDNNSYRDSVHNRSFPKNNSHNYAENKSINTNNIKSESLPPPPPPPPPIQPQKKINPFGNAKPVDVSSAFIKESTTDEPKEHVLKKKLNPFGNAKPVDVLSKEIELEKKLKKFAIDDTTFHLHGGNELQNNSKSRSEKSNSRKVGKKSNANNSLILRRESNTEGTEKPKLEEDISVDHQVTLDNSNIVNLYNNEKNERKTIDKNNKRAVNNSNSKKISQMESKNSFSLEISKTILEKLGKNKQDQDEKDDSKDASDNSDNIQKKYTASFVQPNISYSSIIRDTNSACTFPETSRDTTIENPAAANDDDTNSTITVAEKENLSQDTENHTKPLSEEKISNKIPLSKKTDSSIKRERKDTRRRNSKNRKDSGRYSDQDSLDTSVFHKPNEKSPEISFLPRRSNMRGDRGGNRRHRISGDANSNSRNDSISFRNLRTEKRDGSGNDSGKDVFPSRSNEVVAETSKININFGKRTDKKEITSTQDTSIDTGFYSDIKEIAASIVIEPTSNIETNTSQKNAPRRRSTSFRSPRRPERQRNETVPRTQKQTEGQTELRNNFDVNKNSFTDADAADADGSSAELTIPYADSSQSLPQVKNNSNNNGGTRLSKRFNQNSRSHRGGHRENLRNRNHRAESAKNTAALRVPLTDGEA